MYKRLLINIEFFSTRIMKIITLVFMIVSFQNFWSQSKLPNNYSNDTIVVIITSNNNELRGLLVKEDFTTISLEIANELKTFRKEDIKSYRYITRDQIKSIKEFDNPNPIYTKYCYLPSAYITEKGTINTNSHYFITSNSKIGIHENFEISFGNIFIYNVFSSLTYSKNLKNSFNAGISLLGNFNLINASNGANDFNGWGIIPRITYGDKFGNTTIGFIGYQLPLLDALCYGGYLASQKKITERFTLAGEIIGLTVDGYNVGVINNIIINYTRSSRENWSVGVTVIDFEAVNLALDINFVALPYIGIQRKF